MVFPELDNDTWTVAALVVVAAAVAVAVAVIAVVVTVPAVEKIWPVGGDGRVQVGVGWSAGDSVSLTLGIIVVIGWRSSPTACLGDANGVDTDTAAAAVAVDVADDAVTAATATAVEDDDEDTTGRCSVGHAPNAWITAAAWPTPPLT